MALDPNIPLSVTAPIAPQTPTQVLGDVINFEKQQRERKAGIEAEQDQSAWEAAMRRHSGDPDKVIEDLNQTRPTAAFKYSTMVTEARKKTQEAFKLQLANEKTKNELIAGVARSITDEPTLQAARRWAEAQYGPQAAALLPTTYDPVRIKAINDSVLSAKDYLAAQQKALDDAPKTQAEWQKSIANVLRFTKTPEQWDGVIKGAEFLGAKNLRQVFGDFSPENVKAADSFLIPPEKREELASQDAARKEAAREREANQRRLEQNERDLNMYRQDMLGERRNDRAQREADRQAARQTPTDDPTIPNGVKAYVATMPAKYGTRQQAEKELKDALPALHRDHPRLDDRKMFSILDAYYGRRSNLEDIINPEEPGSAAVAQAPAPSATPGPLVSSAPATPPPAARPNPPVVDWANVPKQPVGGRVPSAAEIAAARARADAEGGGPSPVTATPALPAGTPTPDTAKIAAATESLKSQKAGIYATDDGTFWRKDDKGTVTQALPPPVRPEIRNFLKGKAPAVYHLDVDGQDQSWRVYRNGTMMRVK